MKRRYLYVPATALMAFAAIAVYWHVRNELPRDFAEVAPGVLYRSRQPEGRQWHALKTRHIATVINLRSADEDPAAFAEERRACAEAGAKLVNIPVFRMPPTPQQVRRFLDAVAAGPQPVLVHCQHGRTRAGIMVAAFRVAVQRWPVQRALDEMTGLGDNDTAEDLPAKRDLLTALASPVGPATATASGPAR